MACRKDVDALPDKMALRGYDFAKRRLGLSDRFANELLRLVFNRKTKKR